MVQANILNIEHLHAEAEAGRAHVQAIHSCEALVMKMSPPTHKPRLVRLSKQLAAMKRASLGIRHEGIKKMERDLDNCRIDKYLKFGGEVIYKAFKAPHGTESSAKCKPYIKKGRRERRDRAA